MAQQMRAFEGRIESRALQGCANDVANGAWTSKSATWRPGAKKNLSARGRRTRVAQVVGDRRSHILRQRESVATLSRTADAQFPCLPVQIVERQFGHFAAPQAEAREQQQDRIVATTLRGMQIALCKQVLYLGR